jgi:hypothetical protein
MNKIIGKYQRTHSTNLRSRSKLAQDKYLSLYIQVFIRIDQDQKKKKKKISSFIYNKIHNNRRRKKKKLLFLLSSTIAENKDENSIEYKELLR